MKLPLVKRFVWMAALVLALSSCLKEGDKTILLNDPQDIPFITDYLPEDLLRMFGEENVAEFKSQTQLFGLDLGSIREQS